MRHCAGSVFMIRCIKNSCLLIFGLIFTSNCYSQEIPIGSWRSHASLKSARLLAEGSGKIFCSSGNGLFYFDRATRSLHPISKINGLGDTGVTALRFLEDKDMLIIGYRSGVIDLVYPEKIEPITTLREVEQFDSKQINDFIFSDDKVYAATDVGVALIDLENTGVRDIYNEIGIDGESVSATEVVIFDDTLFTITDQGLSGASVHDNLLDFNNWKIFNSSDSILVSNLVVYRDSLFLVVDKAQILKYRRGKWIGGPVVSQEIEKLKRTDNGLYVLTKNGILKMDDGDLRLEIAGSFENGKDIHIEEESYFVADSVLGLVELKGLSTEFLVPNGPQSDVISRINVLNNRIYLTYGQFSPGSNFADTAGYDVFNNGLWNYVRVDQLKNLSDLAEYNSNLYISSYGDGLYNYTENQIVNSLSGLSISDLMASDDGIWALNVDGDDALYFSETGLEWEGISSSVVSSRYPVTIKVSRGGLLWIQRGQQEGGGISVFDADLSDSRLLNSSDGLPDNFILDYEIDHDDESWICTREGLAFFFDASFILGGDEATTPFFDTGNLSSNEPFTAIAFDGGNRRWFGTERGLWLFNENLTEQIHHFNTLNSPLPSDNIKKLAYNEITGELFILTDRGLISLQTDSSAPGSKHSNVVVFPNPISRSTGKTLAIKGLVADAEIKIADVSGNILAAIRSNGSTASWNMRSHSGEIAPTGVYLIFSSNEDGEETYIGKFVITP